MTFRDRLREKLDPPPHAPMFNFGSAGMVGLVLASLVTLALETEAMRPDTPLPHHVAGEVAAINAFIVGVFAIEYLARLWCAKDKLRYAATPLAIADLLAFLPELLVTIFIPHATGGWLAGLRALRLFRLFKLARYVPAFAIVGGALRRAGAPLFAAACVAAAQVYIAALLLYFIEGDIPGQEQTFGSVTRALWWSVVTLTTVGYGDAFPVTPLGRIAAALVAIAGIGIVAMPTGILASAFADEFHAKRDERLRLRQSQQQGRDAA